MLIPLHQGLILCLYNFHLALELPKPIQTPSCEVPANPNPLDVVVSEEPYPTSISQKMKGVSFSMTTEETTTVKDIHTLASKKSVKSKKRKIRKLDGDIMGDSIRTHKNLSSDLVGPGNKHKAKLSAKDKNEGFSSWVRRSGRIAGKLVPQAKLIDYSESASEASTQGRIN